MLFSLIGKQKISQEVKVLSPLAAIALCFLLIIGVYMLLVFRRTCHPRQGNAQVVAMPLPPKFINRTTGGLHTGFLCVDKAFSWTKREPEWRFPLEKKIFN